MKKVKLSIVIPVYNVEKYLEKCLSSLTKQIGNGCELIIVNDGSTDKSLSICKKYEKYKNVNIYTKKNGGLSSARNYGIEKAKGEYIGFVDSDDWVSDDYINNILAKISEDSFDLVAFDLFFINDGWESGSYKKLYNNFNSMDKHDFIKECFNPSYAWARVYKKELIESHMFPKENIWYEDMYIMPSIISDCKKIGYIERGLYFYRQRDNSITSKKLNDKTLGVIKAWENGINNVKSEYLKDYFLAVYKSIIAFMYFKPEYAENFLNFYKKYENQFKNNEYIKELIEKEEYEDLSEKILIPKKIHYCWFGNGKKSEIFNKCLESWKKYAPDFEIIEWNETNCDVTECQYIKEAYDSKKWAFVADYFRVKVLKEEGGIYVDTDMEFNNYIHKLLLNKAFFAFETSSVHGGMIGAIPNNKIINELYLTYLNDKFILDGGRLNTDFSIPIRISNILKKYTSIKLNGKQQHLEDDIMIYSADVMTLDMHNGQNIAEHHYEATWWDVTYGVQSYKYSVLKYYFHYVDKKASNTITKQKIVLFIKRIIPSPIKRIIKKILYK